MHGIYKPLNWSPWYILLHFSPLLRAKSRLMSYAPNLYISPQVVFSCICLNLFASWNAFVQQLHFYFLPRLLHQRSQAQIVFSSVKSDSRLQSGHVPFHYPCLWSHMLWQAHAALPHRDTWTHQQLVCVTWKSTALWSCSTVGIRFSLHSCPVNASREEVNCKTVLSLLVQLFFLPDWWKEMSVIYLLTVVVCLIFN